MAFALWNWLSEHFWRLLGLRQKSGTVLLVGLDFAGKTTLLNLLKTGRFTCSAPTARSTAEQIVINTGSGGETLKLTAFDLGGHKQQRRVWKDYYHSVDAVIFILDASDRDRLPTAAAELNSVLSDPTLTSARVPVAVLANKIDAAGSAGEAEILYALGIFDARTGKGNDAKVSKDRRPLELFMCSFLNRQGYGEAFRWLANFL